MRNENVIITTLCYVIKDEKILMLFRNKKKNDINNGKWIGIGGKKESDESIDECLLREVKEEAGIVLLEYKKKGIIKFNLNKDFCEEMHVYVATKYYGDVDYNCNEGTLEFIDKDSVFDLNLWEGDKIFLPKVFSDDDQFKLELNYKNDKLISYKFLNI